MILLPIIAYLRMQGSWNPEKPGFNIDLLVYKNDLRSAIPDDALCIAGNDATPSVFFYYIDKKGWVFSNNELTEGLLKERIQKGAQYLYSDSRVIDESSDIEPYLEKHMDSFGSIRIYKLSHKLD